MEADQVLALADPVFGQIPLYVDPPRATLQQEAIQELAAERLKLLAHVVKSPVASTKAPMTAQAEADAVAHFTLRLVCCSDHAKRRWFLTAELALLSRRWDAASRQVRLESLAAVKHHPGPDGTFAVHFTKLPYRVLAERRAVLRGGMAYVPESESILLLQDACKAFLSFQLERAAKMLQNLLAQHPPLKQAVNALSELMEKIMLDWGQAPEIRAEDGGGGVGLTLYNFEELKESFPPCMQHLVQFQRAGCHLKNEGRVQLRAFLREAGLGFEDSIRWWKRELLRDPAVTPEAWKNDHSYQVQYAYGLVGGGKKAFARGCRKTIETMSIPPARHAHGCPFKVLGQAALQDLLLQRGLTSEDASAISAMAKAPLRGLPDEHQLGSREQEACAATFFAQHPDAVSSTTGPPGHPNEFLRRSCRCRAEARQNLSSSAGVAGGSSSSSTGDGAPGSMRGKESENVGSGPSPDALASDGRAETAAGVASGSAGSAGSAMGIAAASTSADPSAVSAFSSCDCPGSETSGGHGTRVDRSRVPALPASRREFRLATGLENMFKRKWQHLLGG